MKKAVFVLSIIFLISCWTYASEGKNEFHGKIGMGYASKPEKLGLDVSLSYMYGLDPYFAPGVELDFFWVKWERVIGKKTEGLSTVDVKTDTHAMAFPLFLNAQVRFPEIFDKIDLVPSVTVGLGYTFMLLHYSQPQFTDISGNEYKRESINDFYSGFAWQALASIAFRPEKSTVYFFLDAGYRGAYPQKSNKEIDLSGFMSKLGVKLKF